MSQFDAKFIKNLTAPKNFAGNEVLITSTKIDWRLGNSFKRIFNPAAPDQIQKMKFSFSENFRVLYFNMENISEVNAAKVYFPLGYWPNNAATPYVDLPPLSKQLLRITSIKGEINYELIPNLAPYILPFTPAATTEFMAVSQTGGGSGGYVYYKPHPTDNDIMFVAPYYDSVLGAFSQSNGLCLDMYDGQVSVEMTNKFKDINVTCFDFNEDKTIAWVFGHFGDEYAGSVLDAGTSATNPRILQMDVDTGEVESIYQITPEHYWLTSFQYAFMKYHDGKLIIRADGTLFCFDLETSTIQWVIPSFYQPTGNIGKLYRNKIEVQNGNIYALAGGYNDGVTTINFNKNVLMKISVDGVVDQSFYQEHLPLYVYDESTPWNIAEDDSCYLFAGGFLFSFVNGHVTKNPVTGNAIVKDFCIDGENFIAATSTANDDKLSRIDRNGFITETLHSYALPVLTYYDAVSSMCLFEGNIYLVRQGKVFRHSYDGTLDPSFNPIRNTASLSYIIVKDDMFFCFSTASGFSNPYPVIAGGTLISGRVISKVKISTNEVLGSYPWDYMGSYGKRDMEFHPLAPDRMFIREQRGYKTININTMIEDNTWMPTVNGQTYFTDMIDDYIYFMGANNSLYGGVNYYPYKLYRFNLATKQYDQTFQVTIHSDSPYQVVRGIASSADYIYVSYSDATGQDGNTNHIKQVKKSDGSIVQVDMALSGLTAPVNTNIDMCVLNNGTLAFFAFNPNFQAGGLPNERLSKTFILVDEATMTKVGQADDSDIMGTYFFDSSINTLIYTFGATKIATYNFTTMTYKYLGDFGYLGQRGAKNAIFVKSPFITKLNGTYYLSMSGYAKRVAANGLVELDIDAAPLNNLG